MNVENTVDYVNLKRIFDELFDRVAQQIEVKPKVERPKTEKQIEGLKKKALMEKLMKSRE